MPHAISRRLNETVARLAAAKPRLILQSAVELNPTTFRIVASHAPIAGELNEADYSEMLRNATEKKFSLIPDTVDVLTDENTHQEVITALIEASAPAKRYDEDYVRANMRVLAANSFMDDTDQTIWRVVGDGDNRMLVQSLREDFAGLLSARLARTPGAVVASAIYSGITPANGDYIYYYNTEAGNLAFGFAVTSGDQLKVFDRTAAQLFDISAAHVVAAADGTTLDKKYSLAAHIMEDRSRQSLAENISPSALNAYLDYMRTLYSGTEYFRDLEKLVKLRRSLPGAQTTTHE